MRNVSICRHLAVTALIVVALQGASVKPAAAQAPAFEEYGRNWGLASVGALFPWGAGATGRGAVIALVDSGVAAGHPDLAGKIIPGIDFIDGDNNAQDETGSSHGTFVAALAVGSRNGSGIVGVAYDARLIPVRVRDASNFGASATIAQGINWATNSRARIITVPIAGGQGQNQAVRQALEAAAGAGKAVIMPAGNTAGGGPLYPAQYAGAMGGHGLIVGALAPGGAIAGFSNRAGGQRENYVVAPGDGVTSATKGGGFSTSGGTSWASGFATGAVALLLGAFPELSGKDAISILKDTATDLGAPGVDGVYGHGAINVRNALAPNGDLSLQGGGSEGGVAGAIVLAAVVVGGAIAWDRLREKDELKQAMIIDGYGRGYTADITGLIAPRDDGVELDNVMRSLRMTHATTGMALGERTAASVGWSVDRTDANFGHLNLDADDLNRDDVDWSMSFNGQTGTGSHWALGRNTATTLGWGHGADAHVGDTSFRRDEVFSNPYLGFASRSDVVALGFKPRSNFDLKLGLVATDEDDRYGRVSDSAIVQTGINLGNNTRVSVALSHTTEKGNLLGGGAGGPFSVNQAATTALGVSARYRLGEKYSLIGSWSTGRTVVDESPNALLDDVSQINSDAWGLGVVGRGVFKRSDMLGVAVSRPLRVSSGSGVLNIPFSNSIGGVGTRRVTWDMAPDDAEIDLELFYQRPIGAKTSIGAWFLYQDSPFHSNDVEDRASFFTTLKREF